MQFFHLSGFGIVFFVAYMHAILTACKFEIETFKVYYIYLPNLAMFSLHIFSWQMQFFVKFDFNQILFE